MIWFSRLPDATKGILFMLVSVTSFSLMDAVAKLLGQRIDVSQVLFARYGGQLIIVLVLFRNSLPRLLRTDYPRLQWIRGMFQLAAAACFFIALKSVGLPEATAVADLAPVMITLGAALILKERVGPRRAFGIAAAMVGALIVIRPTGAVFTPASLWPLGSALCLSGYALATRYIGKSEPPQTALLYSGIFGTAVMALIIPFRWVSPDATAWTLIALIGVIGTFAQLMMIQAYSSGEASAVAPFSYAGLITASLWSVLIFDAWPDTYTVLGALVIVSAGLYVWHRETQAPRPPQS
ncbi:DMT family transporter [Celeribacter sp.]|uniref:DMT family transporter n=1 Tax=Celeribacter sp. TaxID=1890673 RepID=UPI003A8D73AD